MSPIPQRFGIPCNEADFEKLCLSLLRHHWKRPKLQLYGKRGEEQTGVDIIDVGGEEKLYGAQCKLKEESKNLPPAEIEAEVNKAKTFRPPLDKYAILTTGKVSTQAQRKVRELNRAHRSTGLFEIEIYHWGDICDLLQQYPEVYERTFEEFGSTRGARIEKTLFEIRDEVQAYAQSGENSLDALIDEARDAVNRHDYQIATILLNRIEQKHGHLLQPRQKFRVFTNHAIAALGQGEISKGAKHFLDALSQQPEDENARINEVAAYYILGEYSQAFHKAELIRPLYPTSTKLASYWVLTAPPEKATLDLENELGPILLTDVQLRAALASKALGRQELELAEIHAIAAVKLNTNHGNPYLVLAQVTTAWIMESNLGRRVASDPLPKLIERGQQNARAAARYAEAEKDLQTQVEAQVLLVDLLLLENRKQEAADEADLAYRLAPDNLSALLARSQIQFANDQIDDGIVTMERAYAVEPRADVAFNYGNALFNRAKGKDHEIAIQVLKSIDLTSIVPQMRHGIALLTVRTFIKTSDWDPADQYLDEIENRLTPESILSFRGFLAYSRGESKRAETFALDAQKALSSTSGFEVKIFLGRLFVMIGRLPDALPLFQEAFDANVPSFDAGNLLDCAARMRRDGVVINTFRTLRARGVNDWGTVSFGVQYLQKYVPLEAVEVLDGFLKDNPDHKLAKLYRSVIGVMSDRAELVNGSLADMPSVEELPVDHILQVIHALRYANHPNEAVDYAYSFLRLHFNEPNAHRALLISMTPFEPVPTIEPKLDRVEVGAAVSFRELPSGNPQWRVIETTAHPSAEFEEISADSTLAVELRGKQVGEKFLLAPGMVPRHAEILQIVPKYVRRYGDTGDQWQIRFPGEPMIESVHLGSTAEEAQASIEVMLKAWEEAAQAEVQMRQQYSSIATPLHIFGAWNRKNAYFAIVRLAQTEEQFVRVSFGTQDEQTRAFSTLQSASSLVLDLSTLATLQMLGLGSVLTTNRFTFLITEDTWKELRQTLGDKMVSTSPSISVEFRDGQRVPREVTVEEKQRALQQNKAFLDLVQRHSQVIPVIELAFVEPDKRDGFEKIFGQYGAEAMLLASKPGMALWTDDLVQSEMAAREFGSKRVWTQAVLGFLASLGLLEAKERDAATANLISMGYNVTMFDCASIIEAVHLCDAKPWRSPLKDFVREFGAPNADLRSLFPILWELIIKLYRESLLPESRCRVVTAFLDVLWKNPTSRNSILSFRANSPRLFGLNSVGQSQFESCFDNWIKAIENPLIPGL